MESLGGSTSAVINGLLAFLTNGWVITILGGLIVAIVVNLARKRYTRPNTLANLNNFEVKLDGKWVETKKDEPTDEEGLQAEWRVEIHMLQNNHTISGRAVSECVKGEPLGKVVRYEISGNFINNILDVSFIDSGEPSINISNLLLQYSPGGDSLRGYRSFLGRNRNAVRSVEVEWIRHGERKSSCGTR